MLPQVVAVKLLLTLWLFIAIHLVIYSCLICISAIN